MDSKSLRAGVVQEAEGARDPGLGGANSECACALHALGEEAAVWRAPRRCFSRLWPTSPANPVSLGYTPGGDVSRTREGATMPVRRVAQPLGFLIPAAWLGGAAVAIEAQSRLGAPGEAGQGWTPSASAVKGTGRWAQVP